jgi:hypothetical protein
MWDIGRRDWLVRGLSTSLANVSQANEDEEIREERAYGWDG